MTDYESQVSRDTLVRLIGEDAALRLLWEENHCLQALLADTEARVKDTEEQLNSTERLLVKRNGEMDRLVAAIDAERADYTRILASREQEITDVRNMLNVASQDAREACAALTDERDYWKKRANELADRMAAEVQPLLVGDPLVFAALAYRDAMGEPTSRKITAIKKLRELTGLGLRESKLAVEQVIKIMEMKEATVE